MMCMHTAKQAGNKQALFRHDTYPPAPLKHAVMFNTEAMASKVMKGINRAYMQPIRKPVQVTRGAAA